MSIQKLLSNKKFIHAVAWLDIIIAVLSGGTLVVTLLWALKEFFLARTDGPTEIYMAAKMGPSLMSVSLLFSLLTNALMLVSGVLLLKFRPTKERG